MRLLVLSTFLLLCLIERNTYNSNLDTIGYLNVSLVKLRSQSNGDGQGSLKLNDEDDDSELDGEDGDGVEMNVDGSDSEEQNETYTADGFDSEDGKAVNQGGSVTGQGSNEEDSDDELTSPKSFGGISPRPPTPPVTSKRKWKKRRY
ncbi:hypothetical protein OJ253_3480 [Cryptosporidium canis]|uniref:Signal peptide-containing protein n=1 Tax=Cryptosporidium canis TaxID=195482 RepID=A0A9D5DED3_9CRYT|nr:hypothetical protein OJ253_3480 [Cryptosporidium canis]